MKCQKTVEAWFELRRNGVMGHLCKVVENYYSNQKWE